MASLKFLFCFVLVKIPLIFSLPQEDYPGKLKMNAFHHFGASQGFEKSIVQQLSFFKCLISSLLRNPSGFNSEVLS